MYGGYDLIDHSLLIDKSKRTKEFLMTVLKLRECLHGGGGPQVGEVDRLGGVTCRPYNLSF